MDSLVAVFAVASVGVVACFVFFHYKLEGLIMGINDTLKSIKDSLTEATDELVGKITELQGQVAAGDQVDPALLDEVAALASGLADVVDDAPVVDEAATDEAATDEAEVDEAEVEATSITTGDTTITQ